MSGNFIAPRNPGGALGNIFVPPAQIPWHFALETTSSCAPGIGEFSLLVSGFPFPRAPPLRLLLSLRVIVFDDRLALRLARPGLRRPRSGPGGARQSAQTVFESWPPEKSHCDKLAVSSEGIQYVADCIQSALHIIVRCAGERAPGRRRRSGTRNGQGPTQQAALNKAAGSGLPPGDLKLVSRAVHSAAPEDERNRHGPSKMSQAGPAAAPIPGLRPRALYRTAARPLTGQSLPSHGNIPPPTSAMFLSIHWRHIRLVFPPPVPTAPSTPSPHRTGRGPYRAARPARSHFRTSICAPPVVRQVALIGPGPLGSVFPPRCHDGALIILVRPWICPLHIAMRPLGLARPEQQSETASLPAQARSFPAGCSTALGHTSLGFADGTKLLGLVMPVPNG